MILSEKQIPDILEEEETFPGTHPQEVHAPVNVPVASTFNPAKRINSRPLVEVNYEVYKSY